MSHQNRIYLTWTLFAASFVVGIAVTGVICKAATTRGIKDGHGELKWQDDSNDTQEEQVDEAEKERLARQHAEVRSRTTWNNPACIAGNEQCIDCHQQETRALLASKHSTRAFDLLRTADSSLDYAKKLGIRPSEITRSSICVNCHGTPHTKLNGKLDVISEITCESCHGSSLGDRGWLNIHASYGSSYALRHEETPEHFSYRQQRCDEAGHLRTSNLYAMTKRCFDCHVVGDESLAHAGHNHGDGFEMVGKALGEIRHNFMLNTNENAKVSTLWIDPLWHGANRTASGRIRVMFILGQMVDLEFSLRALARATEEGDFSDSMVGRIEESFELLAEEIVEEIEAIIEDEPEKSADLTEIKAIVDIVTPVWEEIDDDGFDPENSGRYVETANLISPLAEKFGNRDGSKLELFDELDLLPEDYFEGAYDPNPSSSQGEGEDSENE